MAEAIFLAEYASVSYGVAVLDRLVKRSDVEVVYARPVCMGKFLIVVGGDVDDVAESKAEAQRMGGERLLSDYLLTNAHRDILGYFRRSSAPRQEQSPETALGTFETRTVSDAFHCLDLALKSGSVHLSKLWMAHFLAGKTCFVLTGGVGDVEAAIGAALAGVEEKRYVDSRVIPSPDPVTLRLLLGQPA